MLSYSKFPKKSINEEVVLQKDVDVSSDIFIIILLLITM